MKTNGNNKIKEGMKVIYRGSWGHDEPKETTIKDIELCDSEDSKYGTRVQEAAVEDIRRCVLDLADGHWCYGWQVEELIG